MQDDNLYLIFFLSIWQRPPWTIARAPRDSVFINIIIFPVLIFKGTDKGWIRKRNKSTYNSIKNIEKVLGSLNGHLACTATTSWFWTSLLETLKKILQSWKKNQNYLTLEQRKTNSIHRGTRVLSKSSGNYTK